MTPEAQRIAIAEACGWKWMRRMAELGEPAGYNNSSVWLFSPGHLEGVDCQTVPVGRFERCDKPENNNGFAYGAPNYLTDLNAMYEAEKVLTNHPTDKPGSSKANDHARMRYIATLGKIVGVRLVNHEGLTTYAHHEEAKLVHATAAQRAEAFLRTLNLWNNK